MDTYIDNQVKKLREKAKEMIDEKSNIIIPEGFEKEFFRLVDKVNVSLMEDEDNFYGYFLFQMSREIRFDIGGPTAVSFKNANFTIYFNPTLFLNLNRHQMEGTIKHEILHIVSMHLIRAKEYKASHSSLAVNMAMDIVVNKYIDYLPPYATTLEWVNVKFAINLEGYKSFEYYVDKIQTAIDFLEEEEDIPKEEYDKVEGLECEYSVEKTHDIWEESSELDEKTLQEFTAKLVHNAEKGEIPTYLKSMIATLKTSGGELPWNLYLNRLMGTVESNKKKTITRRNRRQPERLDLRGQLTGHKAKIVVAFDISGSISDEEFKQGMKEVLSIVKIYNHEITIIECDDEIRRVYKVKSVKDIKERTKRNGGTKFNPVFEYANRNKVNLVVYFTDGKGEDKPKTIPSGYKILWVISTRGDELSLKESYGEVKKLSNTDTKDSIVDLSDVKKGGYSMNHQENIL